MSKQPLDPARNLPGTARPGRRGRSTGVALAVGALLLAAVPASSTQAATPRMIVGADGDATGLAKKIGAPLAYHAYGQLSGNVPVGKMVNMKPGGSWNAVANASSGSSVYNDIVRWAKTLKGRSGTILFAFHHEPEAKNNSSRGTASDYIAAYRRVVEIFRAQGVTNVEYTWQMTSWAFETKSSDRRYAAKWYPGDSYVDNVGTDPYNWYNCGSGNGTWVELERVMDPSLAFARAHGKKLVVTEFGSQADSRRPAWLRSAKKYFLDNRDTVRAVFYFQFNDPGNTDCHWKLSTAGDFQALKEMATDSAFVAG